MNDVVDYLNKSVWCRLAASPVHGVGVFAIRDIPEGTRLTDYNYSNIEDGIPFLTMSVADFIMLLPEIRSLILDRMLFEEGKHLKFVSPNHDQCLQSFMNHSDTPNSDGWYALRDIACGEEVTEDFRPLTKKMHPISLNHHPYL